MLMTVCRSSASERPGLMLSTHWLPHGVGECGNARLYIQRFFLRLQGKGQERPRSQLLGGRFGYGTGVIRILNSLGQPANRDTNHVIPQPPLLHWPSPPPSPRPRLAVPPHTHLRQHERVAVGRVDGAQCGGKAGGHTDEAQCVACSRGQAGGTASRQGHDDMDSKQAGTMT